MFLLDTNVVSELERSRPSPEVFAWLETTKQELQYISEISLAEMMRGAVRHRDPIRRKNLLYWIENDLRDWFDRGVIPVSKQIAERAGRIAGERDAAGRPISFGDSFIAATAIDYGFILVTRNTKDFVGLPLQLLNPWNETEPKKV